MNPDIENKILDNILTQEQIDRIYKAVEICPKEKIKNDKSNIFKLCHCYPFTQHTTTNIKR